MEETTHTADGISTVDLRLATWLYLNGIHLTTITPVDSLRCSFTFTLSSNKLDKLMTQWVNGTPTADVREVINAYLYLVHRGKEILKARRGI